jgi:hypothetical protein
MPFVPFSHVLLARKQLSREITHPFEISFKNDAIVYYSFVTRNLVIKKMATHEFQQSVSRNFLDHSRS